MGRYTLVDLGEQVDVVIERLFVRGGTGGLVRQELAIGSCTAGWWMALTARGGTKAWLAGDYRSACDMADRRIRAGGWTEITERSCVSPS